MGSKRKILFLTNSEYGQSNVALVVSQELLSRDEVEVHIASLGALEERVQRINQAATRGWNEGDSKIGDSYRGSPQATFHIIQGWSLTDMLIRKNIDLAHGPGIFGAVIGFRKANSAILGLGPTDYVRTYNSCLQTIKKVRPSTLVVDPIFHCAVDACRSTDIPIIVLWPTLLKDVVITVQPYGGILWKYPLTGSGYPFPLPWRLILSNIYLVIRFATTFMFGSELRGLLAVRKQVGLRHSFPLVEPYRKEDIHLCPALPELDFPLHVPENVSCCGPILFKPQPLTSDPDLMKWLMRPTILLNLGSHHAPSIETAVQIAQGLRVVLEQENIQVLWKLRLNETEELEIILGDTQSRVRITSWIQPEIISILESQQIIAFVHHGGANSFFEACKAGVPQLVLPQWLDTYDCAARVEWLGIGLYGNRSVAPSVDASEFSQNLLRLIKESKYREASRRIKEICANSEGRKVVCERITQSIRANSP